MRPVGDLTALTASVLRRSVAVPLAKGAARIVVDLSLTRRIDSQGRDALVECARAVRSARGTLVLVSAPDDVRELLRAGDIEDDTHVRVAPGPESEVDGLGEQRHRR